MVDVVGLQFVVEGERESVAAIKRYQAAESQLRSTVLQGARQVQSIASQWQQANRLYQEGVIGPKAMSVAQKELARQLATLNGYVKSNNALNTQRALAELRAAEATRIAAAAAEEEAHAQQRAAQAYARLQASINPVIAAQQRMQQAHRTVRAALDAEIITRDQAAQTLRQYRTAAVQMTGAVQQATRGQSRLGVVFQQAGFQIGDFAVQVQSGTHYMIALGQQLTQLVGVGAMLAQSVKFIAAFSALGILVPIATAVAGAFLRAGEASETAAAKIKDSFTKRVESAREALERLQTEMDATRQGFRDMDEFTLTQAIDKERAKIAELTGTIARLKTEIAASGRTPGDASSTLADAFPQMRAAREKLARLEGDLARLVELNAEKRAEAERKTLATLEDQLAMAREIAAHGSASVEVARLRAEQEARSAELTEEGAKRYVEIALQIHNAEQAATLLQQALQTGLRLAEDVAGVTLDEAFYAAANAVDVLNARLGQTLGRVRGILSAAGRISLDTVVIEAETRALQAGKTVGEARIDGQMAGVRAELEQAGELGALASAALVTMRSALEANLAATLARDAELEKALKSSGTGTGAGRDPREFLSKMEEELRLKELLVGVSDEQLERLKLETELKQNLGMVGGELAAADQQRIDAILASTEALRQAEDREKRRKEFITRFEDSLSQAMESVVSGAATVEEAFLTMIQAILMEIARKAAIEPISSAFGDLLGKMFGATAARGAVVHGGNVLPFATGGVVSRATTFPMSGGRMGLMGEAGPEAILPLTRVGGKLGVRSEGSTKVVPVQVNIINQGNANVEEKQRRGPDGQNVLDLYITNSLSSGQQDRALRQRFGSQTRAQPR